MMALTKPFGPGALDYLRKIIDRIESKACRVEMLYKCDPPLDHTPEQLASGSEPRRLKGAYRIELEWEEIAP